MFAQFEDEDDDYDAVEEVRRDAVPRRDSFIHSSPPPREPSAASIDPVVASSIDRGASASIAPTPLPRPIVRSLPLTPRSSSSSPSSRRDRRSDRRRRLPRRARRRCRRSPRPTPRRSRRSSPGATATASATADDYDDYDDEGEEEGEGEGDDEGEGGEDATTPGPTPVVVAAAAPAPVVVAVAPAVAVPEVHTTSAVPLIATLTAEEAKWELPKKRAVPRTKEERGPILKFTELVTKVRSIHWFPYDRVGVVNADP